MKKISYDVLDKNKLISSKTALKAQNPYYNSTIVSSRFMIKPVGVIVNLTEVATLETLNIPIREINGMER